MFVCADNTISICYNSPIVSYFVFLFRASFRLPSSPLSPSVFSVLPHTSRNPTYFLFHFILFLIINKLPSFYIYFLYSPPVFLSAVRCSKLPSPCSLCLPYDITYLRFTFCSCLSASGNSPSSSHSRRYFLPLMSMIRVPGSYFFAHIFCTGPVFICQW